MQITWAGEGSLIASLVASLIASLMPSLMPSLMTSLSASLIAFATRSHRGAICLDLARAARRAPYGRKRSRRRCVHARPAMQAPLCAHALSREESAAEGALMALDGSRLQ